MACFALKMWMGVETLIDIFVMGDTIFSKKFLYEPFFIKLLQASVYSDKIDRSLFQAL